MPTTRRGKLNYSSNDSSAMRVPVARRSIANQRTSRSKGSTVSSKIENQVTYNMDDEDCTSTEVSSREDSTVHALSPTASPAKSDPTKASSQPSPTSTTKRSSQDSMEDISLETTEGSKTSVSYSDTEGSTYVSEDTAGKLAALQKERLRKVAEEREKEMRSKQVEREKQYNIEETTEGSKKSVSWSDSDGSTYVSEDTAGKLAALQKERLRKAAEEQEKEIISKLVEREKKHNILDEVQDECTKYVEALRVCQPPRPRKETIETNFGLEDQRKTSTKRKENFTLRLDNVKYYPEIAVASDNDDISAIGFLAKEETRQVFCRRMVPLEIPVRKRQGKKDDISALTAVNFGSVKATEDASYENAERLSRRAAENKNPTTMPPKKKEASKTLNHVNYFSELHLATSHAGLSPAGCGVPKEVAASAFGAAGETRQRRGAGKSPRRQDDDESSTLGSRPRTVKIKVPSYRKFDSMSTIGHSSVNSKTMDGNSLTFDDESAVDVKERGTPLLPKLIHEEKPTAAPQSPIVRSSMPESATSRRIRDLKEKIQKMQLSSVIDSLTAAVAAEPTPEAPKTIVKNETLESLQFSLSTADMQSRSRMFSELKLPSSRRLEKRGLSVAAESAVTGLSTIESIPSKVQVFREEHPSTACSPDGQVPSVVTPVFDEADEVSTLHLADDIEMGAGRPITEDCNPGSDSNTCLGKSSQKALSIVKAVDQSLSNVAIYNSVKCVCVRFWMKHMDSRTPTERAVIGVIILSFVVFFILVISII